MNDIRELLPQAEVTVPNFSHSALASVVKCPRAFLFRDVCRLTNWKIAEPLLRGQFAHLALATLFKGGDWAAAEQVVDSAAHTLSQWVEESAVAWADELYDKITHCKAVALVAVDHLWSSKTINPAFYDILGVEEMFLDGVVPLVWKGVIDLRVRDKRTGHVFLLDWKFTSREPKMYARGVTFGWQASFYERLTATTEHPPVGLLYVIVQTPTIKWKSTQEWGDYLAECRDWYAGRDGSCEGCKWTHSKRAGTPSVELVPKLFEKSPERDLLFGKGVEYFSTYATALPVLENFPPLGELGGHCGRCEFNVLCATDPSEWATIKGIIPRDSVPQVGDPEDHQIAED